MLLGACSAGKQPVRIEFDVRHGDDLLRCDDSDSGARLTDLRFYLQDVELITQGGAAIRLDLDTDTPWQNDRVALIDLEDGSGNCVNGSAAGNALVSGSVAAGQYVGLRFTVGVPESLNHANPLTAAAPLTLSAMHWHWRSGYKFMRAGLKYRDDGYWLHLGSTRCQGVIGDLKGCDAGNRVQVVLDGFVADRHIVVFDFARLLAAVDLNDTVPQSCQMGPDETACQDVMPALGLDAASGNSVAASSVFRLAARQ